MVKFKSENIEKYRDLSDSIKANLVSEGNVIKEKEKHSAYIKNLPEGITEKEIDKLSKYNSKFITAAHVAVGEVAADVFKSNKGIQRVEAEIGFFGKNDNINISVLKEKTYNVPNFDESNGEAKEITKNLVMQTTIESASIKGTALKSIRHAMSEEFKDLFKK